MQPYIAEMPYAPGEAVKRSYHEGIYSSHQAKLWEIMQDCFITLNYGYGCTRGPAPGVVIDMPRFYAWRQRWMTHWRLEAETREGQAKRAPEVDEIPEDMWLYWYQCALAAVA